MIHKRQRPWHESYLDFHEHFHKHKFIMIPKIYEMKFVSRKKLFAHISIIKLTILPFFNFQHDSQHDQKFNFQHDQKIMK